MRPAPRDASGCGSWGGGVPSLRDIVAHYVAHYRDRAGREMLFFAVQPTFAAAVGMAGLAEGPGGKRLAHQRRIPRRVLEECARSLDAALPELKAAPSFEALHEVVRAEIGGLKGVGDLTIYDTALRIAAWRGLEPARVFLHAGTRVGARYLGLNAAAESFVLGDLPAPLRRLRAREIEDVLCIYKGELATLGRDGATNGRKVYRLRRRLIKG